MQLLADKLATILAGLIAAGSILLLFLKINRSPCPNHMASFDKVYGRIETMESKHAETMTVVRELKVEMQNTNRLLGEVRDDMRTVMTKMLERN